MMRYQTSYRLVVVNYVARKSIPIHKQAKKIFFSELE